MKRSGVCLAAALAAVLSLSATMSSAWAADDYVLNVVLPQTGTAAYVGQSMRQAFDISVALVNREGGIDGHPLRVVYRDDGSNPQTAVQAVNQILESHPQVILGSALTSPCEAMMPLIMANGPLMYCLSPGPHPQAGSFAFSTGMALDDIQLAMVRYVRQRGWTKIAHLATTDATGKNAEASLVKALALPENKDIQVVSEDRFNATDLSVSAQIERIRIAQPQVLFVHTTGTPMANVFKALIQADIDIPVAAGNSSMSYALMKEYKAFLPKQMFVAVAAFPEGGGFPQQAAEKKRFYDTFAAAGVRPDLLAANIWDPLMMVVAGLRKLGVNATAEQLRAYIADQVDVPGVNGLFDFKRIPQRGLDVASGLIVSWDADHNNFVVRSEPGGKPLN